MLDRKIGDLRSFFPQVVWPSRAKPLMSNFAAPIQKRLAVSTTDVANHLTKSAAHHRLPSPPTVAQRITQCVKMANVTKRVTATWSEASPSLEVFLEHDRIVEDNVVTFNWFRMICINSSLFFLLLIVDIERNHKLWNTFEKATGNDDNDVWCHARQFNN